MVTATFSPVTECHLLRITPAVSQLTGILPLHWTSTGHTGNITARDDESLVGFDRSRQGIHPLVFPCEDVHHGLIAQLLDDHPRYA